MGESKPDFDKKLAIYIKRLILLSVFLFINPPKRSAVGNHAYHQVGTIVFKQSYG